MKGGLHDPEIGRIPLLEYRRAPLVGQQPAHEKNLSGPPPGAVHGLVE
jgi:hypothetical protein